MKHDELGHIHAPTEDACGRVAGAIRPIHAAPPDWRPLNAPGRLASPASDARLTWPLLDGWTRLTVPSIYPDVEGDGYFSTTLNGLKRYPLPKGPGEITVSENVTLPDQWSQERHHHHAWYAISARLSPCEGESLWLRFDAVAHACVLFVNGKKIGRHLGGYTPFEFDVTSAVRDGENDIVIWTRDDTAVRDLERKSVVAMLDVGKGPVNDNFAGVRGGIYLERRMRTHVARIRVRTSTRDRELRVETWLRGDAAGAVVHHAVHEWPNGESPVLELSDRAVTTGDVAERGDDLLRLTRTAPWANPKLWSPARPNLYVLRSTIVMGDRSESIETRFGFREFWIDGKQFMLNGKPIRLLGDGNQMDELRSIVPESAREFDRRVFDFLKDEFHFMSVRLHENLFPGWAVQAADEAGFLVINQSGLHSPHRDAYQRGGEKLVRNLEKEYEEWYWRDVNSPSVVIWDMENELIRGKREPELTRWVSRLDDFIKKHEPSAITQHSGAGWHDPAQQTIHVHMHEQYSRLMRDWNATGTVPLILGEYWIGGNGETRLPNSLEYATREDWHREEARLYRERTLEMRYHGVCGIMPHRLTHWALERTAPLMAREDASRLELPPYEWRFPSIRAEGARGLAPVVVFVWPRGATVIEDEPFSREIVVCNDHEDARALSVSFEYAGRRLAWEMTLGPTEQRRFSAGFAGVSGVTDLTAEVRDADGTLIESDAVAIHAVPRSAVVPPVTGRRLVVVPNIDAETREALAALGLTYDISETLPENATDTIVIVPPEAADDALGSNAAAVRRYLEAGGRLLSLAQDKPPRWLPVKLSFWPSSRTSVPAYTGAGWAPTNKDLNFTREAPTYAVGHPALSPLMACDVKDWHPIDGRVSDDAFVRPNALNKRADGLYRVLIGATRRENASLVECRMGNGTAMLCQARVLNGRAHPAARTLLFNMLRYLDGPAWMANSERVALMGSLKANDLAELTGVEANRFVPIDEADPTPSLILAGDHADPGRIQTLAATGAVVLVLSSETCARLPGFKVEHQADAWYSGTRAGIEDHPLFWGVSGASFLPLENTPANGALAKIPADARVLLGGHAGGHSPLRNDWTIDIGFYGLETREPAPTLAAALSVGDGEIIATTLEPWDRRSETHRQLLTNLLGNAGIDIPPASDETTTVEVKHTAPLRFDGRLDDWTNDTDDVNISIHSHAQPVILSSRDRLAGEVDGDLDFSGVVYLLHDDRHLYVGGIVFASKFDFTLEMDCDGQRVSIAPTSRTAMVDGQSVDPPSFAVGRQPANEIIDTRLLDLTAFNRQIHKTEAHPDTPGKTFELALPWSLLGRHQVPEAMRMRIRLIREDGAELCQPPITKGEEDNQLNLWFTDSWLPTMP